VSNFIIKQEGPNPRVAEKVFEVRLGVGSFILGVLAGAAAGLFWGVATRSPAGYGPRRIGR
jgi:hypothetical protein